jgi:hypothetical protein
MKYIVALLVFVTTISCARKAEVRAPEIIHKQGYSYIQDDKGRLYIVTTNSKDFDEALKNIHPGPASVDKLDLWVITPLAPAKKEKRP